MGIENVRNKQLSLTKDKILTSIPFDSSVKRATVVVKRDDGNVRVYTKGAPDVLYGKNKEQVDQFVKEETDSNPNLTPQQAVARAEKRAGYGMVTRVAVPNGAEGWYDPANANL